MLVAVTGGLAPACEIDHRSLIQEPLADGGGSDEVGEGGGAQESGGAAGSHAAGRSGQMNTGDSAGEAGSNDAGASNGSGGASANGGTSTGGKSGAGGGASANGGTSTGGKSGAGGGSSANGGTSTGGKSGAGGGSNPSGGSTGSGGSHASGGRGSSSAGNASGGHPPVACPDLNGNSLSDCSETLLKSASFDASFTGAPSDWRVDNGATASWDSLDATSPYSGSVVLTSSSADTLGMDQCVALQSGKSYEAQALMLIQAPASTGFARMNANFYPSADCSGNYDRVVASFPDGTINSWRTLHVPESPALSDRSLRIRLEVLKASGAASISVHFDSVLLTGK